MSIRSSQPWAHIFVVVRIILIRIEIQFPP